MYAKKNIGEKSMIKVLVVDDDPEILVLIKEFLSEFNTEVITTSQGLKVMEIILKEEPDVMILDIRMPDIDGLEILRRVRSNPLTSFIPIIMLTGEKSPETQLDGLTLGADDYITKPFDPHLLYARILSVQRRSLVKTRLKYEQTNLLRYLADLYTKRNYEIFTKLLLEYPDFPKFWKGFVPDMIILKKNKARLFCFETTQSILEEDFLVRLKALAESFSRAIKIKDSTVIIRSKENAEIVSRIITENNFHVKIKIYNKHKFIIEKRILN